jgi:hypothetical protein
MDKPDRAVNRRNQFLPFLFQQVPLRGIQGLQHHLNRSQMLSSSFSPARHQHLCRQ